MGIGSVAVPPPPFLEKIDTERVSGRGSSKRLRDKDLGAKP
jgi:hypothetical protein